MSQRDLGQGDDLADRMRALRAGLDDGFARPRDHVLPEITELLAIRIGDDPYALYLSEIQALLVDRPITRLPTPVRDLLGLCSVRGAIAPVYDLAAFVGRALEPRAAPRWLVLARHREPVALAFDGLEGQTQVATAAIASPAANSGSDSTVLVRGVVRPLIRLASVLDAIEQRVRPLREP